MNKTKVIANNRSEIFGEILNASNSLILYRNLPSLPTWAAMETLIKTLLEEKYSSALLCEHYYNFLHCFLSPKQGDYVVSLGWKESIVNMVLHIENSFTRYVEQQQGELPQSLEKAVHHDLNCIRKIGEMPWGVLLDLLKERTGAEYYFNPFEEDKNSWGDIIAKKGLKGWDPVSLVEYYSSSGTGPFSLYRGFYWNGTSLEGIANTDPITLNDLLGCDIQKRTLIDNTEKFIKGHPANNVLLYGDKGTGKSSMVKALLHQYGNQGLRIVELPKIHLQDYHKILNLIENRCFKFILFIDDLSFEEHEVEYKHIKALLEGGLKTRPSNLLVYATSNRRHIVRELASDRSSVGYRYNDRDEISPTDSMQEKLSLADRFGITLTFISPNQRGYLEMVEDMAKQEGLPIDGDELRDRALQWEKRYNGRSGRTARQFIDDLKGSL